MPMNVALFSEWWFLNIIRILRLKQLYIVCSKKYPEISLSMSCVYRALGAQTCFIVRHGVDPCRSIVVQIAVEKWKATALQLQSNVFTNGNYNLSLQWNGIELRTSKLDYIRGPPSMVASWPLNMLLPRHRLDVRTCIFRSATSSGCE